MVGADAIVSKTMVGNQQLLRRALSPLAPKASPSCPTDSAPHAPPPMPLSPIGHHGVCQSRGELCRLQPDETGEFYACGDRHFFVDLSGEGLGCLLCITGFVRHGEDALPSYSHKCVS
jgi:hypothetical protein